MGNGESTSRRIAMQRADDGSIQVSPSGCSNYTVIAPVQTDFGGKKPVPNFLKNFLKKFQKEIENSCYLYCNCIALHLEIVLVFIIRTSWWSF